MAEKGGVMKGINQLMNVNVLQCNQGLESHCQRSYRSPVGGVMCQ